MFAGCWGGCSLANNIFIYFLIFFEDHHQVCLLDVGVYAAWLTIVSNIFIYFQIFFEDHHQVCVLDVGVDAAW